MLIFVNPGHHKHSPSPQAGVSNGVAQPPVTGNWHATGTYDSSVGYSDAAVGSTLSRTWTIRKTCTPTCSYTLTRPFIGYQTDKVISAKLVPEGDAWRASWPEQRLSCGGDSSDPIYWTQRETWSMSFSHGGTVAQADESSYSYTPRCGYGRASVTWSATLAK